MSHNSIQKRINKGIIQFGEIDKIIKINSSTKNKPDNIAGLYSTLTPTESSFAKNKNLVISSNINKIKSSKVHSSKNNSNINSNNINNDSVKKNLYFKNKKSKGSSSSTNIKSNYNVFKTKNLKSAKSLLNNINHFGNSIKININLPRPNMNNNNYKIYSGDINIAVNSDPRTILYTNDTMQARSPIKKTAFTKPSSIFLLPLKMSL